MKILYNKSLADFRAKHPLKYIIIKDKKWEYLSGGKGNKTIVILPGGLQNAESCFDIMNAFEHNYRVLIITVAGAKTINELCDTLNTILDYEKIHKIFLFGRSLGGLLAQSYVRRNQNKVEKLILSHTAAPSSKTFINKVVKPIMIQNILLSLSPMFLVRFVVKKIGTQTQLVKNAGISDTWSLMTPQHRVLRRAFQQEFIPKHMTKKLLKTTCWLTLDFYRHEKFTARDLDNWKGKILITRTDNDPLMQDDGEFIKLYPQAKFYTFTKTGHLTDFIQFEKTIEVIRNFLED